MALIIRKRANGEVHLEGDPPDEHVFSARHIERELQTGLIEVLIGIRTDDGPHYYRLQGFEPTVNEETGETTGNLSGWVCTLQEAKGNG